MTPRYKNALPWCAALALIAFGALTGCDRKPSTPPTPTSTAAANGPTAAGGGAPSASYPAGIKPAPSGDPVQASSEGKGPSEGGTAIGGMTSSQNSGAPTAGAATQPTAGDGGGTVSK